MESNFQNNKNDNKSGSELLAEIGRLTLLLILKIIAKLVKITIKGAKYVYACLNNAVRRIIDFWNANDTQVKLRITRIKLKAACSTLKQWTIISIKATAKFITWCVSETIKAIIHLKPTLQRSWAATKKFTKACCEWVKRRHRIEKIKRAKRIIAYRNFRQHKGFKGLLIDIGNHMKSQVEKYMDEEQVEASEDAYNEEIITEISEEDSTAQIIGKRIFSKVKTIVDVNEDKTSDKHQNRK